MQNQTKKNVQRNKSTWVLILIDLISIGLSFFLAIAIRELLNPVIHTPLEPIKGYWPLILLNVLIIFVIFTFQGLYRGYGTVAVVELRDLTQSLLIAYVILAFSAYLVGQGARLSRIVFVLSLVFCLFFVPLLRFMVYNLFSKNKSWGVKVIVIGTYEELQNITSRLSTSRRLGFNPVILLCTSPSLEKKTFQGIPIQTFSNKVCRELSMSGINICFYASKELSGKDPVLNEICQIFPTVYYALPESNLSSLWVNVTDLLGRPTLEVRYYLLTPFYNHLKRFIEFVAVALFLLISLPITLILALLIYLEDKGPIFFTQDRLGLNGKTFKLIKFRTMVPDAESILNEYLASNPNAKKEYDEFHKLEKDPRVTKIGGFLRKFSLDEIPQFLNVINGDMNLVGPRAYMVHELDLNDETTQTILRVRPGVTGWWQVMGRNESTFVNRQKLDMYYITNWSTWVDYYILIKTVWVVISGQGK